MPAYPHRCLLSASFKLQARASCLREARGGRPRLYTWGTFQALLVPSFEQSSLTPDSVSSWRSLELSCRSSEGKLRKEPLGRPGLDVSG